ncbi:MAG: hypothetical protein UR60_C0006G0038 [Candidatus Moranbacteria bacterium GW2011_GWF2_34_56]|nr:MAG: hypothetical protein UR51_C0005G0042 [Candidatus Moranbacteria bacterium GW2011_GWF1_34_10]KKP65216.1 MAG: hypothetical protein UR60_C0006G0038 [Candidatus Moranbacteria bacterium GW2011_GWF2_34_56]HBI17668.1 electron transporter RnfE [Candidatus Moranbacteria bacterium]
MMGTFCNTNWGWGLGFGWFFMLIFWGLIIWAIIYLAKNLSNENRVSFKNKKAFNILKERYARGEISEEEFEKMKKNLQ